MIYHMTVMIRRFDALGDQSTELQQWLNVEVSEVNYD